MAKKKHSQEDHSAIVQAVLAAITHPAGYAAGPTEFWVQGPDTIAPTVTAFVCDATSSSLVVPISSFTATDDVAVTKFAVTESATPPAAGAAVWAATAPTSVTASAPGTRQFWPWAQDAAGNVSGVYGSPATCVITISDTTPPTVTGFDVPATSDSRTIPINTFTATDNSGGAIRYMVTESGTPPLANDPGWSAPNTPPTSYTTGSDGAKTLRAWAQDPSGNVSNALTDTCTVTVAQVATPTFSPAAGTVTAGTGVTISTSTTGATIHYTTDGTAPTTGSPTYSSPVTISAATTLRAIAVKSGMSDSSIGVAAYTTVGYTLSGLAGNWIAAKAAGGTSAGVNSPTPTSSWADLSSNAKNLSLNQIAFSGNSGWLTTPNRLALTASGVATTNDRVRCDTDETAHKPAKITVELKFRLRVALGSMTSAFPSLVTKNNYPDNSGYNLFLDKSGTNLIWRLYANGSYRDVTVNVGGAGRNWQAGSDYHLFGTFDGRYVRLYEGTTEVGSAVDLGAGANFDITHGTRKLSIGCNNDPANDAQAIQTADVDIIVARLYSKALSPTEIATNVSNPEA